MIFTLTITSPSFTDGDKLDVVLSTTESYSETISLEGAITEVPFVVDFSHPGDVYLKVTSEGQVATASVVVYDEPIISGPELVAIGEEVCFTVEFSSISIPPGVEVSFSFDSRRHDPGLLPESFRQNICLIPPLEGGYYDFEVLYDGQEVAYKTVEVRGVRITLPIVLNGR